MMVDTTLWDFPYENHKAKSVPLLIGFTRRGADGDEINECKVQ